MSFLFPLFLLAGICLAIPVLIHLFNLRRYKTILFPHTRFLKNIQLHSQKQSQLRYKWLLAMRLLFLFFLILAFAQPFFSGSSKKEQSHKLQLVYIDNSYSMSVKKGARTLLDIAKDAARKQVQASAPGSRFILLSNDRPGNFQPLSADKILTEINSLDISAESKTLSQILARVQHFIESETAGGADLYCYSDFQKSAFAMPEKPLLRNVHFYGIPVQNEDVQNIFIDSAWLAYPVLQSGQSNQLVVRSRLAGKAPKEMPVMQVSINGQVKSAVSPSFKDKNESTDTLNFTVNDANWQKIVLSVNDASLRFDDTFRIAARSAPGLSVLAINEGEPNAYIMAAFRAYNGFRLNQVSSTAIPANLKDYNLVILNGITRMNAATGKLIGTALEQGQSICIFPGRTHDVEGLNEGLKLLGDIKVQGIDTASQIASNLQQGSNLVKDLFEKIPENVQLPVASWHYIINAGLSANQQSILSFRNGDPFLALYKSSRGQLYICAVSADLQSGNFPGSYFFVPFLYQMAVQSRSSDVYAITSGKQEPVFLSLNNAGERNMVHVYGKGIDVIPPQHPGGAGLDVFIDQVVHEPGFYKLTATGTDTTEVALNQDRSESLLEIWNLDELKSQWGDAAKWMDINETGQIVAAAKWNGFPLWKVCAILALIMLAVETYLLAGRIRKPTVATQ